jgi:hypothetical protein
MATAVDSSADAAFTVGAATHAVRLAASTAVAAGFMAALSPTAVEASTVAVEGSTAVAVGTLAADMVVDTGNCGLIWSFWISRVERTAGSRRCQPFCFLCRAESLYRRPRFLLECAVRGDGR